MCRVRILREPREHLPILGNSHGLTVTFTGLIFPLSCNFLSRTGVPRHSAGGVGMFVRTYVRGTYVRGMYRLQCACVVRIICNAHARVMEAENSITLTIYSSYSI